MAWKKIFYGAKPARFTHNILYLRLLGLLINVRITLELRNGQKVA